MQEDQLEIAIALSDYAHQVIRQNFQKVIDQEKAVFKDKDPEALHQMRVGMRRLRTAMRVFSNVVILPDGISEAIGKIAKGLGKTRDLDVLQKVMSERYQSILTKAEQPKFEKVMQHLGKQRSHSFVKLKQILKGDRYQNCKLLIQDWLVHPDYTTMGSVSVSEILPDLLLPLICQLFLHSGWLVGTTMQSGRLSLIPLENTEELNYQLRRFGDELHDLRKQIKGVRYQAEFFDTFYEDEYKQRIDEFRNMQEVLGQLQDNTFLSDFLRALFTVDLAQVLPTIDQIIQQDTQIFWQKWQPFQEHYLSLDFRKSLRSLLTTPTA
ncbi:CHAD domain-containing protein [Pseudanabaena mucicola]|uniref:CHAD domain-containing protein n=1 Tax=Pseudanabaena mucicola FACHB-723 TaxID=2692860 RepID=A0ABR7ZV69_9CYAN|nr:CHAD domain-containing protein [Pseudanabaena mucicola]MBD2187639.1 CHAD domain-containing protein [Pseudanabaena mucicola FACHB-723]